MLALEELQDSIPSPSRIEEKLEERELVQAINTFLSTLDAEDRKLFVARYWYLASIRELAEKNGSTQGKIKMKLYRMRNALRKSLEEANLC